MKSTKNSHFHLTKPRSIGEKGSASVQLKSKEVLLYFWTLWGVEMYLDQIWVYVNVIYPNI